jgi:RND superfamily putative drug exporter
MKRDTSATKVSWWLRIALPLAVVAAWLGIGGIGGPYFGKISEVSSNDQTSFLPASAEATKVQKQLGAFTDSTSIPAILLFTRGSGLKAADLEFAGGLKTSLAQVAGVKGAISPAITSQDGKAAFVVVPVDSTKKVSTVTAAVSKTVNAGLPAGLTYYATGPAGFLSDLIKAFAGIDGILLGAALAVVFVILLIVYRSPLLPFLVLFTSMFALTASIFAVWWLAHAGWLHIDGQVQGILFILVIGAATDYSLLYVSRYREELRKTEHRWEASKAALKGAFEPILASGGTVIVGLLCLLFSDLNSNKALGPAGAIGIAMSIMAALTLLPALLALFGRASFWPMRPLYGSHSHELIGKHEKGLWPAVARWIQAYPREIWMVSLAVLVIAALGIFGIRASGVQQSDLILVGSQARDGQKELGKHFPSGSGSPVIIIGAADKLSALITAAQVTGIYSLNVVSKDSPSGSVPVGNSAIAGGPFANITPTVVNGNIMLRGTLASAADSHEAEDTVIRLRESVHMTDSASLVGGVTATALDTNTTSIHDRNLIIPIVLVAITIILMLLLRSVVAPLLLLGTTILSFGAALGVSSLIFNHVMHLPGADPSVPLFGFIFLVALGIDYNIFLMTRVREESLLRGTRDGVLHGLVVTGGVITSAGIVLAATFAALAVIPILFLVQLAFIVAFGVLLDALLVRSLLVPALIYDLGPMVWWPSKLRRRS